MVSVVGNVYIRPYVFCNFFIGYLQALKYQAVFTDLFKPEPLLRKIVHISMIIQQMETLHYFILRAVGHNGIIGIEFDDPARFLLEAKGVKRKPITKPSFNFRIPDALNCSEIKPFGWYLFLLFWCTVVTACKACPKQH